MRQLHWTVEEAFEIEGVGGHTGAPVRVRVGPAPFGTGIRFHPWGQERFVPALIAHASAGEGCTVLTRDDVVVQTPEHLLAALYGCGITDVRVDVDGPELPILDGSAHPWCLRLAEAGRRGGPRQRRLQLREPVWVELAGGWATATPHGAEHLRVEVDFGPALSGVCEVYLSEEAFQEDVAWARTFALREQVERLRAAGRGGGANLENTVIYDASGPVNEERGPREGVRHKLLDLVGDLALAGAPVMARIVVHKGSHRLHQALVREIVAHSRMGLRNPW